MKMLKKLFERRYFEWDEFQKIITAWSNFKLKEEDLMAPLVKYFRGGEL